MIGKDLFYLFPHIAGTGEIYFRHAFEIRAQHGGYGNPFEFESLVLPFAVSGDDEAAFDSGGSVFVRTHTGIKRDGKGGEVIGFCRFLQKQFFFIPRQSAAAFAFVPQEKDGVRRAERNQVVRNGVFENSVQEEINFLGGFAVTRKPVQKFLAL